MYSFVIVNCNSTSKGTLVYVYSGMYNVYVKRKIFIITEIMHMNAGVNSEKEKVKESQSRRVAPLLDIHFGCRVGDVTPLGSGQTSTLISQWHKILWYPTSYRHSSDIAWFL